MREPKHRTGRGFRSLFPEVAEFCWRCGRRLTGDVAKRRRYGRVCWKRHLAEQARGPIADHGGDDAQSNG